MAVSLGNLVLGDPVSLETFLGARRHFGRMSHCWPPEGLLEAGSHFGVRGHFGLLEAL